MSASDSLDGLEPAGFFALRSPLLPFDDLRAWSDGLCAPAVVGDAARLEAALSADRALLTERLLASGVDRKCARRSSWHHPSSMPRSSAPRRGEPRQGAAESGGVLRADGQPRRRRSGCSRAAALARSRRRRTWSLDRGPTYGRHTRLDMDYLSALVSALETDPAVRQTLRYQPNSSLYRAGARLHYAEARLDASGRSYHLVALDETPELSATLDRASTRRVPGRAGGRAGRRADQPARSERVRRRAGGEPGAGLGPRARRSRATKPSTG